MASYELKNRAAQTLHEVGHAQNSKDRDDLDLARVGKKSVLKNPVEVLPPQFTDTYLHGLAQDAALFFLLSYPQWLQRLVASTIGWLTVIGWQSAFASTAFLSGTEIQGAAILAHERYNAEPYQGTLIMWASIALALGVNLVGGKLLPRLENLVLVLHILGFLAILIPLTYMSDHKTAKEVFTTWTNEGGWSSNGIVFFLGMQGGIFAFAGGDAAVHMAEEVQNASVTIPRAIIMTIMINGTLGFGMLIAVLFCMGDLEAAMETPTGYPFMQIFYQATNSLPGSLTMISIMLIIGLCATIGMLAATSRQFWSFARDQGIPGWRLWSKVSPTSSIPIYSVIFTMIVASLLGLINIGSDVALNDVVSMAVSGLYLSYLSVGSLLLYRRVTGAIYNHESDIPSSLTSPTTTVNVPGSPLVWGPFRVPGILGIAVNVFAIIYMIIVIFFSFWPTEAVVDYTTMNYSVVSTFGTVIIAVIYYFIRAKNVYRGPIIETM
ncbi:putative amino acid permease [Aspergillus affinis]|uniref:putative amino acid permease n=1 Tax=Aspergillus affinis TaxID=1070780 RepID=UPI0022FDBBB7|nr:putative amino acid permease [Aspergillus affinis]KAI9044746.1 putative amino acid permease [Aspergillus affinis]